VKLLVGLGNPGKKHAATRHNIGFMVVDRIAEKLNAGFSGNFCDSAVAKAVLGNEELVLAKPMTYMNNSGMAVTALLDNLSLTEADLTVIHDDIDIPLGKIKEKTGGGSAGHNGIESVVWALESENFRRIRMGVGRPPAGVDPADYVLCPFEAEEMETVAELLEEGGRRAIKFG
jgi:PTH1 family peptidyl-tRNA hydrolase